MNRKNKRRKPLVNDPDDPTTKKIKKILREKHPGYEKNSIDGEAFDSACETISFYLTRGRIEEARAVLNVIPFVPISLSEKRDREYYSRIQKKGPLLTSFAFINAINNN